jgi:hypothetical protein
MEQPAVFIVRRMNLFGRGASPFQIPELKRKDIEKVIRNTTVKTLDVYVPASVLQQIAGYGFAIQNCAVVITNLLRIIDDYGSHTHPVYKALYILIYCFHSSYRDHFVMVGRTLVPEIASILYLSFDANSAPFRDRIHCMASAIWYMLMYNAPLPRPEDFGEHWVKVTHRPAPPPETYQEAHVVSFVEAPPADKPPSDDDTELDFDPRALTATMARKLEPLPLTDDVLSDEQPPAASDLPQQLITIEPEPVIAPPPQPEPEAPPPNEDDILPVLKTGKDLLSLMQLMVIRRMRYDDDMESC